MEKTIKTQIEKGELTAGSNISYWTDSATPNEFPKLRENLVADVVIVGGGNSGLNVAYQLLKAGKSVVLVEDGLIGSGETGRTSAHLTAVLDGRYFEIEKMYGAKKAKLIAQSHMEAIGTIENIIKSEYIECDFKRLSGILFLNPSDDPESIKKEFDAATEAGLDVVLHDNIPGVKNALGASLEFTEQAKFHPMKYLKGLAGAVEKMGGKIFNGTHAEVIDEKGITSRDGFRVSADHIVVATSSPVNNKYMMHLRQYAYRTYLIGACVPKNSVQDYLYWDTGDQSGSSYAAYHYVTLQEYNDDFDLLICGGEDHPTGLIDNTEIPEEESRYQVLETWLREHFPVSEIIYQWSGQVMYAFDSLGYIGRNPFDKSNIYIVTGDCGNGLTYGTIAGVLITDLITGDKNEYENIYRPSRFNLLKAGHIFIEEIVSGLAAYLKTKPRHPDDTLNNIPVGEGKIVEINGKKYGAFHSYDHHIHIVESECTHLGCIVKWNSDEKSWDCPCHGSRFTNTGTVINGPANINLNSYKIHVSDTNQISNKLNS